nr:MAG TPA: hypothetical protein [Caudoviricetes sp.]
MMLEEMCSTCIHSKYCAGAYRKKPLVRQSHQGRRAQ